MAERSGMVFVAPDPPSPRSGTSSSLMTPPSPPVSCRRSGPGPGRVAGRQLLGRGALPLVDAGTFGVGEAAEVERHEEPRSFVARREHPFANREDPGVAEGLRPLVQSRPLTYRLDAPFHLQLQIDFVVPTSSGSSSNPSPMTPTGSTPRCGETTSGDDPEAIAAAIKFKVECSKRPSGSRKPATSWSSPWTPPPRSTRARTARPSNGRAEPSSGTEGVTPGPGPSPPMDSRWPSRGTPRTARLAEALRPASAEPAATETTVGKAVTRAQPLEVRSLNWAPAGSAQATSVP